MEVVPLSLHCHRHCWRTGVEFLYAARGKLNYNVFFIYSGGACMMWSFSIRAALIVQVSAIVVESG